MSEMKFKRILRSALAVAGLVLVTGAMAQSRAILDLSAGSSGGASDGSAAAPVTSITVNVGDFVRVRLGAGFATGTPQAGTNMIVLNLFVDMRDSGAYPAEVNGNNLGGSPAGANESLVEAAGSTLYHDDLGNAGGAGLAKASGALRALSTSPAWTGTGTQATTNGAFFKATFNPPRDSTDPFFVGVFFLRATGVGTVTLATTKIAHTDGASIGSTGTTLRTALTGAGNTGGYYMNDATVTINIVPEPSTIAAVVTGLAGMLALRRRK